MVFYITEFPNAMQSECIQSTRKHSHDVKFSFSALNRIQMKFKQSVANLNVNVNILSAGLHKTVWSMTIQVIQMNETEKEKENKQQMHCSKANTEQCKAIRAV